jgi:hypothetical protein
MSLGMACLALFLIIWGLLQITGASFQYANVILGILALIAGIAILVGSSVVIGRA